MRGEFSERELWLPDEEKIQGVVVAKDEAWESTGVAVVVNSRASNGGSSRVQRYPLGPFSPCLYILSRCRYIAGVREASGQPWTETMGSTQ